MIKIRRLNYAQNGQQILDIKKLEINKAGFYVILGDSGSGKTTLLHAISGFLDDYSGEVIIDNRNLGTFTGEERARLLRTKISLAFQHFVFINDLTVADNIGLVHSSYSEYNRFRHQKIVSDMADKLNISSLLTKKVRILSGGEKSRVNIARTLIKNTPIYLFDEPTAMLDFANAQLVMELLKEKSKEHIVILVTHDLQLATMYADEIITLNYGKIVRQENIKKLKKSARKTIQDYTLSENSKKIASSLFKAWKKRNFIASFSANFALAGIGLSLLLVNSLNIKLTKALQGPFNEEAAFVATESSPNINVIKSLDQDDITYLSRNHNLRCSSFFVTDFDQIFTAKNEVVFYHQGFRHVLPSFHANLFNEVLYLEEIEDETFPYVYNLDADEIILDLPIDDFRVLLTALNLPYRNNAAELGVFLENNEVNLILNVGNYDWDYFDEQIFRLKAVRLKANARIITSNLNFAENLFIDKMRLLSSTSLTKVEEYPWVLKKLVYVFTKRRDELLYKTESLPSYVMQTANNSYFRTLSEESALQNRVLFFKAPPRFYELFTFVNTNNITNNYLYTTPYFTFIEQLLLIGFSMNFYVSADAVLLSQIAKEDIDNNETSHVQLNVPDNVVNLSLQNSGFGALSFKSTNANLKLNEIIISTAAAEKIFGNLNVKNETLHVQALTEITNKGGLYEKKYETYTLKIVNVIKSDVVTFYHHHLWQYLLFKDIFKISPFAFKINGLLIDDDVELDAANGFIITKPFIAYNELINEALANIETYSLFVSLTALVVSFFIVIMVIFHLLAEAYPSLNNLNLIGYDKRAIQSIGKHYIVTFFIKLYITVIIELLLFSFIIEYVLSRYFMTKFSYVFTVEPYVVISLLIITLLFLITVIFQIIFKSNHALTFSRRDL